MGDRPRIVINGAGATGRGQIGQVAHSGGWDVTFIERRRDLVDVLRGAGRYAVGLAGEQVTDIEVSGFRVLHTDELSECAEAIAEADIVATAVIPTNLPSTAPTLAAGIAERQRRRETRPLNVIACENMEHSSTTLRALLKDAAPSLDWAWVSEHVGFPDAMVARAVPVPEDPLYLLAEAAQEWSVDLRGIREPMPRMEGMTLSHDQDAALERKLYIKNTGHFAFGVLGHLAGYTLMDEAARDPHIFEQVDSATRESAAAVAAEHGFDAEETEDYRAGFMEGMKSPFLPDEIIRVVREPIRKLSRNERLVGPALLSLAHGGHPSAIAAVIAASLRMNVPGDHQSVELQRMVAEDGVAGVMYSVGGIEPSHPLSQMVAAAHEAGQ